MKIGRLLFVISVIAGCLVGTASADTYLKQASYIGEMNIFNQVQPAKYDTVEMWLSEGKAAMIWSGQATSIILREKDGKVYMVDHTGKRFAEMPVDLTEALESVIDQAKKEGMSDSVAEAVSQMADSVMRSASFAVTPTDETKKIGKWNTRKYLVLTEMTGMRIETESWASEDIEADYDLYQVCSNAMMAQMPSFERMCREMRKIKGIPVEQVGTLSIMGNEVETRTTLIDFAVKEAPDGTYDIPEGYQEVDLTQLGGLPMGR